MGDNDNGIKGDFDAERTMAKMMAEKGIVSTGAGAFLEVSPKAGEQISEDIDGGSRFSDHGTDGLTP